MRLADSPIVGLREPHPSVMNVADAITVQQQIPVAADLHKTILFRLVYFN
jgi:hypothetical protein